MENSAKYQLLVVEDDVNLGIVIQDFLESAGFIVSLATSGSEAHQMFKPDEFDLALLDVMLPDIDGMILSTELRKKQSDLPVIFVTAKSMPDDRIAGLKLGADDYITKPFQPEELRLRIEAVLRRYQISPKSASKIKKYVRIGNFRFYPAQLLLKLKDEDIEMTSTEASLLQLFFEERNGIVTREMAFQKVWGVPDDPGSRNLDVYVGKLRKLLSSDPSIAIRSIHGKGYKIEL